MESLPYKHYLQLLKSKPSSKLIHKLAAVSALAVFIAVGTFSAFYYQYQKVQPQILKYEYLQQIGGDFTSANQSVNEVLTAFKVAGAKVQIVDKLQETPQATASGFYVALDDLEKTSSLLDQTQQALANKQQDLEEKSAPLEFATLAVEIAAFYTNSQIVISELYADQIFAKELLLASGPKFYLPALTDDKLWDNPDKKAIISYYQAQKDDANIALTNLAQLSPPPHFQEYYAAQIEYLTRLVVLSDNIINTLSVSDSNNVEDATQIEIAYQYLTIARRENELVSQKLLQEKLKLVDVGENLNKMAQVELQKDYLHQNLTTAFELTPKVDPPNAYFEPFFQKVANIASNLKERI